MLVKRLREYLMGLLHQKITQPQLFAEGGATAEFDACLRTIVGLLESDANAVAYASRLDPLASSRAIQKSFL